jgi:hypothetical protein
MKNIFITSLIALIAFTSCSDLLDVEPTDAISADQAINDKVGVDRAITGSYNALQSVGSYGRNHILVSDLPADNLRWSGTTQEYSQIDLNEIAADNGTVEGIWSANYDGINRVNNVLLRIPDITDLSDDERNMYQGEALFLRALFHFNLVGFFGGVPIKTEPTLDLNHIDQARNSAEEVYQQIIADLIQAEELLPLTMPVGHASAFSATALLARVYLSQFQLTGNSSYADLAVESASKVINEGGFSLMESYADLFIPDPNSESIFEVVYDAQNSNRLAQYFFPRSLTGRYEVAPTEEFIQSYEEGDVRLNASIAIDVENNPYGIKYTDITAGTDRVYVLRLAEMYLVRAEARAYSNGDIGLIKSDLDVIRSRAGLPAVTAGDYPSLKLAIENERRHEFAFEGQRWEDLVRTGRAATVMGINEEYTLFPIPLSEMQTNNLITQNPGY